MKYLSKAIHDELADHYDHICRQLALMMAEPEKWMPKESIKTV